MTTPTRSRRRAGIATVAASTQPVHVAAVLDPQDDDLVAASSMRYRTRKVPRRADQIPSSSRRSGRPMAPRVEALPARDLLVDGIDALA